MADFIEPGPVSDTAGIREAVCIHTRKIFDSCREEDLAPLRTVVRPRQKDCALTKRRCPL